MGVFLDRMAESVMNWSEKENGLDLENAAYILGAYYL